jgi:hypothetical protein
MAPVNICFNPNKIDHLRGVENFMECYGNANEAGKILWSMLYAAMRSDIADQWCSIERTDMLLFYELTTNLLTAIYKVFSADNEDSLNDKDY